MQTTGCAPRCGRAIFRDGLSGRGAGPGGGCTARERCRPLRAGNPLREVGTHFMKWAGIGAWKLLASRSGYPLREASSFQAPIPAHFMKWVPTSRSGLPARSGLHRSRAVQPPPGPAPLPDSPSRNMALPHLGAQPVVCMASYDGLWKISGAAGNGVVFPCPLTCANERRLSPLWENGPPNLP